MPNWCQNKLSITGKADVIAVFKEKAFRPPVIGWNILGKKEIQEVSQPLSLANLYPEPTYENDQDWYDWRVSHWGTKWDVKSLLLFDEPDRLVYDFDSAWSPPTEWLQKVYLDFPELSFELTFAECGNGFGGTVMADAKEDLFSLEYVDEEEFEDFLEENGFENYC